MARNTEDQDSRQRNRLEEASSVPNDLPDSKEDREKLRNEETTIDLPDVKDIPGQEFVNAPPLGALGDTTISSDDEEGRGIFGDDDDELRRSGSDFDVSREERVALWGPAPPGARPARPRARPRLDIVDFEGAPLNERSCGEEKSGDDLDIPGNTDETETDAMGQGDEENKLYSMGSSDNDNMNEGTP